MPGLNIPSTRTSEARSETDAETTPLRHPDIISTTLISGCHRECGDAAAWVASCCSISPPFRCSSSQRSNATQAACLIPARPLDDHRGHQSEARLRFSPNPLRAIHFRGEAFASKILSAMRFQFGGHIEKNSKHLGQIARSGPNLMNSNHQNLNPRRLPASWSSSGPPATSQTQAHSTVQSREGQPSLEAIRHHRVRIQRYEHRRFRKILTDEVPNTLPRKST